MASLNNIVKLLATDLDGTLLDSLGQVSQANIDAIFKASECGLKVIPATARSIRTTKKIAYLAGMGPLAICQNGAAMYDLENERLIYHQPLELDNSVQIINELRKCAPGVIFAVEKLDLFIPENEFFPTLLPGLTQDPVSDILSVVNEPLTKIICRHKKLNHKELSELAKTRCGHLADTTSAGGDWVDFQLKGISKAVGLARAAALLGIEQGETAAIGDQKNDVQMLEWAQFSAATNNAIDITKHAADWIAPANTKNGVAAFILRLIEKNR